MPRALLLCILAGALFVGPCEADSSSCTNLRARLGTYLFRAHVAGRWSAYLPDDAESYAESLQSLHWQRVERAVALKDLRFLPSESSVPGPDCDGDCRDCVHRHFLVDGDTLSFTLARVPEECSETPELRWKSPSGDRQTDRLVPLFNWNVEAMWCTPHFVVFGLHADNEGIAGDALALWNLETGAWRYAPSGTQYGSYFTGMSLPGLFPAWPQIDVAEDHGTIVLRGGDKLVVLWPSERAWALVNPATGAAVPKPRRVYQRLLSTTLREAMHAAMLEVDSHIALPEVVQIMTPACQTTPAADAVLVRAATSSQWPDERFGIFLTDGKLTKVLETLEIFPSLRSGDYDALFVPEAPPDSIIVIGLGATYGDGMVVHRFGCRGSPRPPGGSR